MNIYINFFFVFFVFDFVFKWSASQSTSVLGDPSFSPYFRLVCSIILLYSKYVRAINVFVSIFNYIYYPPYIVRDKFYFLFMFLKL